MAEQKKQVTEQETYCEQEGGKQIGTLSNLTRTLVDIIAGVSIGNAIINLQIFIPDDTIEDVKHYRAIRHCYDGDTSSYDNTLNNVMREFPQISKIIGYEPIKVAGE